MAEKSTESGYKGEYWLSLKRLRELLIPDGRTFSPYRVAREILYHEPLLVNHERNEVSALLRGLVEEAERKMEEKGAEPMGIAGVSSSLPKRLRWDALLLGVLYTYLLPNITVMKELERLAKRGDGWLRLSNDNLQAGIYWYELGKIYAGVLQHARAVKAMRKALNHAEQSGEVELQLRVISMLAGITMQHRGAEKGASIIEQGMKILEENPSIKYYRFHRARLLKFQGQVLTGRQEYEKGVDVLQAALDIDNEEEDPVSYCSIHTNLAEIYQTLGDYSTALHHLNLAATIAEQRNRVIVSGLVWSRIGQIHTELQDYDQAHEAFRFAHKFVPEDHTTVHRNITAAEIELAIKTGASTEGTALCNQLLESLSPDDMGTHRSITLARLSTFYTQVEDYGKARVYLEEAIRVLEMTGSDGRQLRQSKSDLARNLIREGETGKARTILEEITGMETRSISEEIIGTEGLEMLSEVERLEGNFEGALKYLQEAKNRALDIAERKNTLSIQNARVLVGIQMTQQQKKLQEGKRKRVEQELARILTVLNTMPLRIDKTEQQLHRTLSWLDPDLLHRVVASLKEVVNTSDVNRTDRKTRALEKVEGVDPEFFSALREHFPHLTPKGERLCGLIRLGLSTQEIAALLGISEDGVWMQRKRLRKRLNIEKDVNLEEFLKGVLPGS